MVPGGNVIGLTEIEFLARITKESQRILFIRKGHLIQPPIDSLPIRLEQFRVKSLICTVAAFGHGFPDHLLLVKLHTIHLVDPVMNPTDRHAVNRASVILFHHDRLQTLLGTG